MKLLTNKITKVLFTMALLSSMSVYSTHAEELNLPGFSGTINTTITSGFSVRASERNCNIQAGYSYTTSSGDDVLAAGVLAVTAPGAALLKNETVTVSQLLDGSTVNGDYSNTCSKRRTDGYGNTSTSPLDYGSANTDDGSLNYGQGDVIDATQKVFSEITGTTDSGLGVNVSFIANINPVNDINGPSFKAYTSAAEDALESDAALLNAYVTTSFDTPDFGYIDMTLGRSVTSWGEATFIPIGMNGLVTNALDLSKLRAPGSSIRDALIPTEQVSFNMSLADNVGMEFYYQFSNDPIVIDPKGSFWGSELAGAGGDRILASGPNKNEYQGVEYCTYTYNVAGGQDCNAASAAAHLSDAGKAALYDTNALLKSAFTNATNADWASWTTLAAGTDHGRLLNPTGLLVESTLAAFTTAPADALSGAAALNTIYGTNVSAASFDVGAGVELKVADSKFVESSDSGQWGVRFNTYLEDVGTGVDLSFYYANYHSKVPYLQIEGEGGVLAGDVLGAYTWALADYQGDILDGDSAEAGSFMDAGDGASTSQLLMQRALLEGGFGSGICGGLGAALGANAMAADGSANSEQKQAYQNIVHRELINGKWQHDPTTCSGTYGASMATLLGVTPTLAGAVYPLNQAKYRFIYPEDNKIMGASFNTNVGGTTVQGEVSFRPDFPLATNAGDQINQIADAAGVSAALTAFAHDTYPLSSANTIPGAVLPGVVDGVLGAGSFGTLVKNVRRSSLPFISDTGGATADYHSTAFIEYDVWSVDIGTTTSFSASHPITQGLGADSAFFLTELAMVEIDGLDNVGKGFVSRGGFNEGAGEHLCLGIFQSLTTAQLAAVNTAITEHASLSSANNIDYDLSTAAGVSNIGAGIVDAVFGNGDYCESNMGAGDRAFSYRLVGGASYNNFNNTRWSLSPSIVYSADPQGYGPSSLGGFTEGRSSMSLGLSASRGDGLSASLNYVDQMGDDTANLNNDKDFVSASVSYSF